MAKLTLREFLKQHKVLGKFKTNLKIWSEIKKPEYWLINRKRNLDAIASGFAWGSTPEGDTFWRKLNTQWQEHVYKTRS